MNLAKSLAEIKKKVLLIDVDLRKSVLGHQVNGERPKKGLTHYLSGQASIADIIYLNEDPKFHIILQDLCRPTRQNCWRPKLLNV